MPDTQTPTIKLIKPEPGASKDTWGDKLNSDLDKLDDYARTDRSANVTGLQTGANADLIQKLDGTSVHLDDESFRVATKALFYADTVTVDDTRPGQLVTQIWVKAFADLLLPVKSIIMWGGVETDIPAGWAMCDGTLVTTVSPAVQTPDLRGRFILGGYHTADTPPASNMHPGDVNDANGVFNHTHPVTVNNTTLSRLQIPPHTHVGEGVGATGAILIRSSNGTYSLTSLGGGPMATGTLSDGNVGINGNGTGAAAPHNHTATSSSNTTPGVPWYALCFIMKVKSYGG